jgi:hypothetical protein
VNPARTHSPTVTDLPFLRVGGHAYYRGRVVRVDRVNLAGAGTEVVSVEIEELDEFGVGAKVFTVVGPLELDYVAPNRVDRSTVLRVLAGSELWPRVGSIRSGAQHTTVWLRAVETEAAGLDVAAVAQDVAALLRPLWHDSATRVRASVRSVWVDRRGWAWTVPALTPVDAAGLAGAVSPGAVAEEIEFTDRYPDAPVCVCGNDAFGRGFVPVDHGGAFVSPRPGGGWDRLLHGCARCGRVFSMGPDPLALRDDTPVLFRAVPPVVPDQW